MFCGICGHFWSAQRDQSASKQSALQNLISFELMGMVLVRCEAVLVPAPTSVLMADSTIKSMQAALWRERRWIPRALVHDDRRGRGRDAALPSSTFPYWQGAGEAYHVAMVGEREGQHLHSTDFAETETLGGHASGSVARLGPTMAPGTRLGAYTLVRSLGQGAMGAVYEGVHATLGRRAAIKVLLAGGGSGQELLTRFMREGQAASRIRHDNVVDVYDVGVEGNTPFLVMELLEGEDLCDLLARETQLSVSRTVDLMVPVLCALAVAHDLGIIHRDLKPSNIFLARGPDGDVVPKIVDFGISKMVDESRAASLTATSSLLGTPYYMSPEQAASSKHIDARTDQYAAGVILYEALSGRRPYESESILALLTAIHTGAHTPLGDVSPDLPPEVSSAVERAMSRAPEGRFLSARELARALLPFAGERVRVVYAKQVEGQTAGALAAAPRVQDVSSVSGAARTANEAPAAEPASRTGKVLLYGTVTFVVTMAGFMIWIAYSLANRQAPAVGASQTPAEPPVARAAGSSEGSSLPGKADEASAPRGAMVHLCAKEECDNGDAWCDERQNKVACCAKGLVARSVDGVCGCPPGGTSKAELVAQGCGGVVLRPGERLAQAQAVFREAMGAFRECYDKGLARSTFEGGLSLWVELTPDGDVITARVESSSIVDEGVQRCILDAARKLRFAPPENGTGDMKMPLSLKPNGDH